MAFRDNFSDRVSRLAIGSSWFLGVVFCHARGRLDISPCESRHSQWLDDSAGRYRVLGIRYQRYHELRYWYRSLTWYRSILAPGFSAICDYFFLWSSENSFILLKFYVIYASHYIFTIVRTIGSERYQHYKCSLMVSKIKTSQSFWYQNRYRYRNKNPGIVQHCSTTFSPKCPFTLKRKTCVMGEIVYQPLCIRLSNCYSIGT